ncbi:Swt1 family HEPN domain-containing protein [Rhizobium laguerreae]|uniref:Swt1 family HEPN domain-containing protein n=1 Tax=Rhizobium laguerreae TaxID=1076926 RepID=UPI001C90C4C3|nr:Swt1 family HEPN domain-containing protein [Rhizobium laguerreae]MBY3347705.1 hypothetical protein [Rhizobium laguerreae]MBY3354649.1 hypothetical protein [Rhizobium laguerreae]MBY3375713.1 hypothetical protein [Rhizobium laguerreae]MBY3430943.1 hypothetical protein [Rhizobium laguerreae]MBY3439590.1 hypothetical protein [Rhizobium laguerreae]
MDDPISAKEPRTSPVPTDFADSLPPDRLFLYGLLWHIEIWLREMVYVELSARHGAAWSTHIQGNEARAKASDSRLTHMPTREKSKLSYILFSNLQRTISKHWHLFREYLPPKDIWKARLSEVDQIRNRVAHFRNGHEGDLHRVRQLVSDVDTGFWHFCTSYNNPIPILDPSEDAVARRFAALDPFPWAEVEPNTFARIGHAPRDLSMAVTVGMLRRPWLRAQQPQSIMGRAGFLYDVSLDARNNRIFDYPAFLRSTRHLHMNICHICLDVTRATIRLTVPSIAGRAVVLPLLDNLVETAQRTLRPNFGPRHFEDFDAEVSAARLAVDRIALEWPEYVLGPSNPLTFLDPSMRCKFFPQV